MGLEANDQYEGGATFLTVRMGTDDKGRKRAILAKRCPADTPGAKQVFKANGEAAVNKDGDAVYRLEYPALTGQIFKLESTESEYNGKTVKYLQVHVSDQGEHYILTLERGYRYWSDFLMRLPNVRLSEPVRLAPYAIEEDGKFNQGISMKQNERKVERKWNAANGYENGPPMAEQIEINDEVKWDFGKRNRWMEANVLAEAIEELKVVGGDPAAARKPDSTPAPSQSARPKVTPLSEMPDDDLPF